MENMWKVQRALHWLSIGAIFTILTILTLLYNLNLTRLLKRLSIPRNEPEDGSLLLLTVATKESVALRAFRRSANLSGASLNILGMDHLWQGLGQKVSYHKQEFEKYKDEPFKVIMYADAYDILINGNAQEIVRKFRQTNLRVLFSAEHNCWPNESLCSKYPPVSTGKKFLNSGAFIGYAKELYKMVEGAPHFIDNDQEFYTGVYLNEDMRRDLHIGLDHQCQIFQTFEAGVNHIHLSYEGNEAIIHNRDYNTYPLVIHTPGFVKPYINSLKNFIPQVWNPLQGCTACLEDTKNLPDTQASYPIVLIAIFIDQPIPKLEEFFLKLSRLTYPKDRLHLFIYEAVYPNNETDSFLKQSGSEYNSTKRFLQTENSKPLHEARLLVTESSQEHCVLKGCEYYFNIEAAAHLDNPDVLKLLLEQNRLAIGPVLFGPGRNSTNFAQHAELGDIITYDAAYRRRGLWSVRILTACYLIRADVIRKYVKRPRFSEPENQDVDFALSFILIADDIDIVVSNRADYGHLVVPGKLKCDIFCKTL